MKSVNGPPTESQRLCNSALAFSIDVLKPGGSFICKFYMSGDSKLLLEKFKQVYNNVSIAKPKSSRPVCYPSLVLLFLTPLGPYLFGVDIKQAYVGFKGSLFGCAG